jgi:hypothetical protein
MAGLRTTRWAELFTICAMSLLSMSPVCICCTRFTLRRALTSSLVRLSQDTLLIGPSKSPMVGEKEIEYARSLRIGTERQL